MMQAWIGFLPVSGKWLIMIRAEPFAAVAERKKAGLRDAEGEAGLIEAADAVASTTRLKPHAVPQTIAVRCNSGPSSPWALCCDVRPSENVIFLTRTSPETDLDIDVEGERYRRAQLADRGRPSVPLNQSLGSVDARLDHARY